MKPRNRFHYSDEFLEGIYGKPFDPRYWETNNPANIVERKADQIRRSDLQVYIECGDEDYLNLHEGTEFLHRLLWDRHIQHEYHSVRTTDHLVKTLDARVKEGLRFIGRVLRPLGPDPDASLKEMKDIFGH